MSNAPLTCVIAEDEQLFREALVDLLKKHWPELQIHAACEDGGSALEAITDAQPTVAFLDIRMPGLTGLEVAAAMAETSPKTHIVFVTAYNQYAVDAFDRGAIDYLLKPIAVPRFVATITRLKERLAAAPADATALSAVLAKLAAALPNIPTEPPLVWITASVGKETRLIAVEDVLYFQSDSKYTAVVTADAEALVRLPLYDLLGKLDSTRFKQIHRATVVNLKAIAGITRDESGRGTLRLKGRTETLTVSLTYMPFFKNM